MDLGRGEERVRCMERVTWQSYVTMLKRDSQWEFAVGLKKLKEGLCINLDEWAGEGDGREFKREVIYVYLWLIHVEV